MEKRESKRIGFNLRVALTLGGGNQSIEILRANINWGGLGGFTRDPVQEGEAALLRIDFPQRSGEIMSEEIPGKIVWGRRDGNFTALGVAFSKIDPASQPQLVSYLRFADQFD